MNSCRKDAAANGSFPLSLLADILYDNWSYYIDYEDREISV